MDKVTETGIELKWGTHDRDGAQHREWHAPCGCAFHPSPAYHWHPCALHANAAVRHWQGIAEGNLEPVDLEAVRERYGIATQAPALRPALENLYKVASHAELEARLSPALRKELIGALIEAHVALKAHRPAAAPGAGWTREEIARMLASPPFSLDIYDHTLPEDIADALLAHADQRQQALSGAMQAARAALQRLDALRREEE